jgi:hypothetical protein
MGRSWTLPILLAVTLATGVAAGDEELLRKAWTWQAGPKATLLQDANRRVDALAARWSAESASAQSAESDPDVQWLLEHGEATYLVLDERLARYPSGKSRSALLFVAARLHRPNLGQYLPGLLQASNTDAERLDALKCMSALQNQPSLRALQSFLLDPPQGVSDELLAEAARGLGMSGRPEYLVPVSQAQRRVKSVAARFEVAKAACRCGDASGLDKVAEVLDAPKPDLKLQAEAISFLCENFNDRALERLASFASTTNNRDLATAAVWAIINGSGYGRDVPEARREESAEPPAPAAAEARGAPPSEENAEGAASSVVVLLPGLPPDVSKLLPDERKQFIEKVAAWWFAEGRTRKAQKQHRSDVS